MTDKSQPRRAHRLAIGDGILRALEERAERERRAGRFVQAERAVRRLLEYDASRRSARRLLGRIQFERSAFGEAFETFRALCEEDASDAWAACRAGEALLHAGRVRAARKWLAFCVDIAADPDPRAQRRARILLQKVRRQRRSR